MKKIISAALFCCASFVPLYSQAGSLNSSVRGIVRDWVGARVPLTKLTIVGDRNTKEVFTDSDGAYAAELTRGRYRLSASNLGLCEENRSFNLDYGETIVFNFILLPCSDEVAPNPRTKGTTERSSQKRPYEEREFTICGQANPIQLVFRYGKSVETDKFIDFSGFWVRSASRFGQEPSSIRNDLMPVAVRFKNEEVYANHVRFSRIDNSLLMSGVRWPANGESINPEEISLSFCKR